ncbi:MAG: NHLP-related RiPP peptide [Lysobacter sp.]
MQTVSIETSKHAATTAKKQRSAPLEPQVADRLLDLLSTDDMFRQLKRHPGKALAQVGFVESTSAPSPFGCFFGISQLASKAQIAEARGEIRAMLTPGLSQTTPNLDAANHAGRRTLK